MRLRHDIRGDNQSNGGQGERNEAAWPGDALCSLFAPCYWSFELLMSYGLDFLQGVCAGDHGTYAKGRIYDESGNDLPCGTNGCWCKCQGGAERAEKKYHVLRSMVPKTNFQIPIRSSIVCAFISFATQSILAPTPAAVLAKAATPWPSTVSLHFFKLACCVAANNVFFAPLFIRR